MGNGPEYPESLDSLYPETKHANHSVNSIFKIDSNDLILFLAGEKKNKPNF